MANPNNDPSNYTYDGNSLPRLLTPMQTRYPRAQLSGSPTENPFMVIFYSLTPNPRCLEPVPWYVLDMIPPHTIPIRGPQDEWFCRFPTMKHCETFKKKLFSHPAGETWQAFTVPCHPDLPDLTSRRTVVMLDILDTSAPALAPICDYLFPETPLELGYGYDPDDVPDLFQRGFYCDAVLSRLINMANRPNFLIRESIEVPGSLRILSYNIERRP